MRKICDSEKTDPTASLIACADARSWPTGFSMTTRALASAAPISSSCSQIGPKRPGATAR